MSDQTVQTLAAVAVAEAEHVNATTDDLMVAVTSQAHCTPQAGLPADEAFELMDRWIAPPATHEHIPQHRWDERTEMIAARLCAPCPVRTECLALAMRMPLFYGDWIRGGMTPEHRNLDLFADATETAEEGR